MVSAIAEVLESGRYALGPAVEGFEADFAAYTGGRHCIGVQSGTMALMLALLAHGVKCGDEVITVPYTFVATAEAISWIGAKPVFVDIDPATYTMRPDCLKEALTPQTKAVVPVHLYGQPADLDPVAEFAREHGLVLIQDAAQAHGTLYRGRKLGETGFTACYSFYPAKNLGACGEGGAVVTDDDDVAELCRALRDHGQRTKNRHEFIGFNARMPAVQGAALGVKLKRLDGWTAARRRVADRYDALLADAEVTTPTRAAWGEHVFHLYVVRSERRDALRDELDRRGVGTAVHYPAPIHLQPCYAHLGQGEGSFPEAERAAREVVSLPMFPELADEEVEYVCAAVKAEG
jgi:dTDP-4-amino-4,6-dideoxygalactose transaminase